MDLIGIGARGEAVRDVQHRLLGVGLRIEPSELDGSFGPSTEAAVRRFQDDRGLPSDGIIGPDTWGQLVEAGYRLGDRTLYLRSPAFRGDDVRELQRMLNALGFDAGKEDGIFGPRTDAGVREFQRNVATAVDGIVGLDTARAITRFRPAVDGPSRAVVREGEAARGPGLSLATSIVALDAERIDGDERDAALAIVRAVAVELDRLGARTLLLRSGAEHPPLDERIRRANASKPAILVSVALGSGDRTRSGSACFYYGTPTTHSPMGRRLADAIQASVVRRLAVSDAGSHPRSIGILRETRMPAVRVEPLVATSDHDVRLLVDPDVPGQAAAAIVDGVLEFSRPAAVTPPSVDQRRVGRAV